MRPLFNCFFIFFTNVAVATTSCFRRPSDSHTRASLTNPSRHDFDLTAEVQTDGSIVIHNHTPATIHVAAIGFTSTAGHLDNPFMPPPNDAVREVAPFTHDGGYIMQPDSTEQLTALELEGRSRSPQTAGSKLSLLRSPVRPPTRRMICISNGEKPTMKPVHERAPSQSLPISISE